MAGYCADNGKWKRGRKAGTWHPTADILESTQTIKDSISGGHIYATEWLHQPNTVCCLIRINTHSLPHTHSQHKSQSHTQVWAYNFSGRSLALRKALLLRCHQTLQGLQIKSSLGIWIIGCPRSIKIYKNENWVKIKLTGPRKKRHEKEEFGVGQMRAVKEVRKSREGRKEKATVQGRKWVEHQWSEGSREGGKGLWVVEVMGCSVFSSHACPCYLETLFPIYQGVRCGIQMDVCMSSEQLRDLKGHCLMSSL